ncbi:hypothetical protein BJ546DRAFT_946178 [Cryomyces antarcticus]
MVYAFVSAEVDGQRLIIQAYDPLAVHNVRTWNGELDSRSLVAEREHRSLEPPRTLTDFGYERRGPPSTDQTASTTWMCGRLHIHSTTEAPTTLDGLRTVHPSHVVFPSSSPKDGLSATHRTSSVVSLAWLRFPQPRPSPPEGWRPNTADAPHIPHQTFFLSSSGASSGFAGASDEQNPHLVSTTHHHRRRSSMPQMERTGSGSWRIVEGRRENGL